MLSRRCLELNFFIFWPEISFPIDDFDMITALMKPRVFADILGKPPLINAYPQAVASRGFMRTILSDANRHGCDCLSAASIRRSEFRLFHSAPLLKHGTIYSITLKILIVNINAVNESDWETLIIKSASSFQTGGFTKKCRRFIYCLLGNRNCRSRLDFRVRAPTFDICFLLP